MEQHEHRSACGDPGFETSLLAATALSRWKGSPVAWIEATPHAVRADLVSERSGLVMIDSGATQADFVYGTRASSWQFRPGSIGLFAAGTELRRSRWRWTRTRRIYVDLDAAWPGGRSLADAYREVPHHTEIEFHDPELSSVLRMMVAEVAAGCPHGQLFAESLSLGVAMRLQERAAARFQRGVERGRLAPAQLRRIEELVTSQLSRDMSLASLAAAIGFSPSQFVRLFKNTVGCTPHQYVVKMKLKRAKELVLAGELPLAAVAQAAGFASQSHMTSAFVRAFRMPPGQMRRQARHTGGDFA